jgi:hypothetical protein
MTAEATGMCKEGLPLVIGTLECGGSTPLSFFGFCFSKEKKKESGVEPPHSKVPKTRGTPVRRARVSKECRTIR